MCVRVRATSITIIRDGEGRGSEGGGGLRSVLVYVACDRHER